jgi:hypothetical protein
MFDPRRPLPSHLFQRSEAGLVHVPIEAAEGGLWCEEEPPANRNVLILVFQPRGSPHSSVLEEGHKNGFRNL